jgi:hypothetical protein
MLEEEYDEIMEQLRGIKWRVPQTGIKFKYGKFFVDSLIDINKKLVYYIRKDNTSIGYYISLYPIENKDTGFTIRDTNMDFKNIMEFIYEIQKKHKNQKKISIPEGFFSQLLVDSQQQCCICLDSYNDDKNIYINICGHHLHEKCMQEYGYNKSCPICRK